MRKIFTVLVACLVMPVMASGLMIGIDGHEEEITDGCEVDITTTRVNIVTGATEFQVDGTVMTTASSLTVTIIRDTVELVDQLCIGSCLVGDGTTEQTMLFDQLPFNPKMPGMYSWFAHFEPEQVGEHRITYTFDDGDETLTFTLHFIYNGPMAIEDHHSATAPRKAVCDGQVVIIRDNKVFPIK